MPVCCDRDGRPFVHVTEAATLFTAVADAITWFDDDFWHGPKPTATTVYDVSLVGDSRKWRVHAAAVERWRATR